MQTDRCHADWQGPSDAECADDLLVIACAGEPRHTGRHRGWHPDDGEHVFWESVAGDLYRADHSVRQAQFLPGALGPD